MTRAEKAGLKAYPENIGYSTIGDTIDCNAEKRRVFIEGYEQGHKDACEWLRNNHANIFIRYIRGYEADDEIKLFKEYMEGKQ